MKRLISTIIIAICALCTFAQSINISFTGKTIHGRHVDMDSIVICNLTQGWTTTLVAPDTSCSFDLTAIKINSAMPAELSQNVPNPFHGTTEVSLSLPQPDKVGLQVHDIGGRLFADYNAKLPEGEHRFEISLASPQSYLLSATTSSGTSSVKMVNLGSGGANKISYLGQVEGKALRDGRTEIHYGDELQFTGYTTYIDRAYESEFNIVTINSGSDVEQILTFNLKSGSSDEIIACDSYTWIDGVTYRESNHTATYTYTNSMDCDSVVTLNLTINHSVNATDTHIACESFTWIDGVTYTEDNSTATFTLQTAEGCDSVVMLNLIIGHPGASEFSETACDNFVWNGIEYTESGDYNQALQSFAGCDSIVTLHLTIVNSVLNMISETACDSYEWNGQTYDEDGIYSQTFTAANGCDSVVKLNLTVLHSVNNEFYESACDTYDWNGEIFSLTGDYIRTFNAANGCDSIVTLHLAIERSETDDEIVACEQYTWIDGVTYTESNNTAIYTLTNTADCDSIVALHLTITTPPEVHTSAIGSTNYRSAVCGGTVVLEGTQVISYGICWSTEYNPTIDDAHTSEAVISETFTSTMTDLEPSTTYYVRAYATNLCGTFYGEQKMLTTCNCESQITDARDGNQYSTVIIGNQCWMAENLKYLPEIYMQRDSSSFSPRYYVDYSYLHTQMDSNITVESVMQLPFYRYYGVLYNYTAAMNGAECTNSNPSGVQGICPNGWHLPSRSEYMELIQSLPDGDKGSQLAGLYNYGIMFWNNGALSQSPKFGLSGLNILPAGRHYAGHPNDYVEETACVWTTSLSTLNSIHNGISIFTISYYETDAHVENTSFHRANSASVRCIKNRFEYDCNTYITDTLEACDSLTWRDGSTYTESNRTATYRIPGENGCDTVYSLWLTIYHSSETTDDIDACESYTWINGITYTGNNNSATYMLQSVHGCDSLVHLNLRIHHTPQDIFVDTRTACDSLVWIDGNTYYEDNDEAIFTTITSAGCDSVVRLNLTIIHPVEYEFNYSDCGAYQWNGQWYTRTGDYTYTYPSAASNGCDSIVTLHYTRLNNNVNDTIYACDSYTWIDGVTYTLDDIGTRPYINALYIGTNSYGCDSLVVMYLFLQANKTIDTHRACDSYTWIDGNTYTESNNTATVTYTNQYGCDSIVQLNLTIEHPDNTIHEVTVEKCSYYQMSNGEYFTESGDYQRTLQSSCGCDSIVLLHLTITGENGMEGTFYDNRDGITYRTMQYGCQTWMAEDLRTSYLPNGTLIVDSIIHCPGDIGLLTYNNYYNTFYANSNNGFCPQGWHLPSSSEWLELANYLTIHSEYTCNETSIVKSIVSNIGWTISNVECSPGHNQSENNLSGLGLNPDGMQWLGSMYKDGLHDREDYVYLVGTNAFYINANSTVVNISNNSTDINFQDLGCTYGARIRCVRDN